MSEQAIDLSFNITMLGARGVGKTSMLAAMSNEFDMVCQDPSLQLIPEEQTSLDLADYLEQLKGVASSQKGVIKSSGILGTQGLREYNFVLHHTESRANCGIVFRDYPGEWLVQRAFTTQVDNLVATAQIVFIAIDVPSLVMHQDQDHERVNQPMNLASTLKRGLSKSLENHDRLVVFALMRGERWLRNGESDRIIEAFERRFARVLRVLQGYRNSTAVVLCPIQTLGSVEFVNFDARGNHVFAKCDDGDYAPKDCDQPLRFALSFLIERIRQYAEMRKISAKDKLKNASLLARLYQRAANLFGMKTADQKTLDAWIQSSQALIASVEELAAGCKSESPFYIYQGNEIIGLETYA